MRRNRQDERPAAAPAVSILIPDECITEIAARVEARLNARPAKRLYNVPETAIYLGRTESAIREMLRSGKLKRASRDGRVMFDRCDLDAWIEAGK